MTNATHQNFQDEIIPVCIDSTNGDGRIVTLVDWQAEADAFAINNGVNLRYSFTLEYLSCHHYLPSLNRIPTKNLPETKLAESDISKQAKMIEFKRKYGTADNFAIQFVLWRAYNGVWRPAHSARDTLHYLGLEGHIDLIYPYLLDRPGVMFGSPRHKLGISITPNSLKDGDYLEINGGYTGTASYILQEEELELIEGRNGYEYIDENATILMTSSTFRAAFYVSNAGATRLYFIFSERTQALVPPYAPFLEPGESLSYEHGKLIYSGGNDHLIPSLHQRTIIKLPLVVAREKGGGYVSYQEFSFQ